MLIESFDLELINKLNIDSVNGITFEEESIVFQLPPLKVLFGISEEIIVIL